jgi:shikimate kinase
LPFSITQTINPLIINNRIVLIGFSGAGKSTMAKKIASHFHFSVLDTDLMLEEKYRISVFDIFEKYGEETFRKLEYNTLVEALKHENVVIATGGGTPCFFDAMRLINETASSIYIKMHPKSLVHRLLHTKRLRPLIINKTEAELLTYVIEQLKLREPFYLQAQHTIKGESINLSNVNIAELQYLSKKNVITTEND